MEKINKIQTTSTDNVQTINVTKSQIESVFNIFESYDCGELETLQYRLKEIAFCIGQCDKGTNQYKHLFETLQDIDNVLGFLCYDELKEVVTQINRAFRFTIEVTND